MTYYVVIGDLKRSRKLEDRADVQRRLRSAVAELNERVGIRPASPLKLTAGDEVQGISEDPRYALEVIVALADAVSPAQFTWGLGCGELSTDFSDDVAMMDGPCFHRAREALERSRRTGAWFGADGIDAFASTVLTAIMNLMGAIRENWTAIQTDYVRRAREHSQIEVARAAGKAPSTVSRALRATKFDRIVEAEEAARLVLGKLGDD